MSATRRDFIAFTIGAIAAQMVLPMTARAEPDPWLTRNDFEYRFLMMYRELGEAEQVALLRGMKRQQAGMPMREAMRGFYVELGLPVPDNLPA